MNKNNLITKIGFLTASILGLTFLIYLVTLLFPSTAVLSGNVEPGAVANQPRPTRDDITLIPAGITPHWLTIQYPKPGATIALNEYNSTDRNIRSNVVMKVPSAICFQIWGSGLLEDGDHWNGTDVKERITLLVDGAHRPLAGEFFDGQTLMENRDQDGNLIASISGPYSFCAPASIEAGLHQVDIMFEKSSGNIESFAWSFTAVNGPLPTPTPLPTPSSADFTGEPPSFLFSVFPSPTDNSSRLVQRDFWAQVAEFGGLEQGEICVVLSHDLLRQEKIIPTNQQEWPDHIFLNIDGQRVGDLHFSATTQYESSWKRYACTQLKRGRGEREATLYIETFNNQVIIYSWTFESFY